MSDDQKTLIDLIGDIQVAMLTTTTEDGTLHAVPMSRQQVDPGNQLGTMVHGLLESDEHRASFLRSALGVESRASFPAARERRLDLLGDLVEEHLDVSALLALT